VDKSNGGSDLGRRLILACTSLNLAAFATLSLDVDVANAQSLGHPTPAQEANQDNWMAAGSG
jgi:hypothetical protein